jgi:hypothetical protein
MRKIIIILLFVPLNLLGVRYYIDPSGQDLPGRNGSISQPWATLSYARTRATTAGDTIYANPGLYYINTTINLPAQINIDGAGQDQVTFISTSDPSTMIMLSSVAGTNGNQSISNITLDGNLIASMGVRIFGRSNVTIHHVAIKNTLRYGLTFADQSGRSVTSAPTIWATGNKAYQFKIENCGRDNLYYSESGDYYTWQADGGMDISGQDGMQIYDFEVDNRTGGRYAYGIKGLISGGYHKGVKIHDGKIRTNIRDVAGQQSFGFNIELWTGVGGIEIYNMDLNGAIDMAGYGYWDDYDYGYAFKVYDNVIIQDQHPSYQPESGMILEGGGRDGMYFLRNHVENFTTGFSLGTTAVSFVQGYDSVVVAYNEFVNLAWATSGAGAGATGYNLSAGTTINKFYFVNNVIHKLNNSSGSGIVYEYSNGNTWTNTHIKNNIIYNCYTPVQFRYQNVSGIFVDNNIIYGHTRTTIPYFSNSVVNLYSFDNNQVGVNPMFENIGTDYNLHRDSPAIDAGVFVGLTRDFSGRIVPIGSAPDIGAHEFGSGLPPVPGGDGIVGIDKGGNVLIDGSGRMIIIQKH